MGRYITSGGRKNALPKSKAGPPEDRGESSRFFRVGPREDRFGVLILLHTEISRNIIPTLALILLFPHTEISTRRYTLNEFKIISHRNIGLDQINLRLFSVI